MSEKINLGRRIALGKMVGGIAAIPLISVAGAAQAAAPQVDEASPAAVGLKYKHDAAAAPRVDKAGTAAADQTCANCQFIQAPDGEWRPCTLFPGKTVNANGWCSAWAKKVG